MSVQLLLLQHSKYVITDHAELSLVAAETIQYKQNF